MRMLAPPIGFFLGCQIGIQQGASRGESEVSLSPSRRMHRGSLSRLRLRARRHGRCNSESACERRGVYAKVRIGQSTCRLIRFPLRLAMGKLSGTLMEGTQGFCFSACSGP